MPPMTKNTIAATPYMMPSFLWSTVKTHDRQPVVDDGPAEDAVATSTGVTTAGAAGGGDGGDRVVR